MLTNTQQIVFHFMNFKIFRFGLSEIYGDLFEAPVCFLLVHCVSQDLKMSAGIAKQFRTVFAKGPELAIWLSYQYREGSYSILLLKGSVRYCLSFDNSG